jgi:hypothetical protein
LIEEFVVPSIKQTTRQESTPFIRSLKGAR